jgi:hypothetical protein
MEHTSSKQGENSHVEVCAKWTGHGGVAISEKDRIGHFLYSAWLRGDYISTTISRHAHLVVFWKELCLLKGAMVVNPPCSIDSQNALARWILAWLSYAGNDERTMMIQGLYGLWMVRMKLEMEKGMYKHLWSQAQFQGTCMNELRSVRNQWKCSYCS